MHYEINVSLNGMHMFATHERSLRTLSAAEALYEILDERFPADQGFAISVTEWRTEGKRIMSRSEAKTATEHLGR